MIKCEKKNPEGSLVGGEHPHRPRGSEGSQPRAWSPGRALQRAGSSPQADGVLGLPGPVESMPTPPGGSAESGLMSEPGERQNFGGWGQGRAGVRSSPEYILFSLSCVAETLELDANI